VLQSQAKKSTDIIGKTQKDGDARITVKSNADSPLLASDRFSSVMGWGASQFCKNTNIGG
jgi:hypothetical protein